MNRGDKWGPPVLGCGNPLGPGGHANTSAHRFAQSNILGEDWNDDFFSTVTTILVGTSATKIIDRRYIVLKVSTLMLRLVELRIDLCGLYVISSIPFGKNITIHEATSSLEEAKKNTVLLDVSAAQNEMYVLVF